LAGECEITFDLLFVHKRRYFARWLTALPYPQRDTDALLFQRLIRPGDVILDAGTNIGVTAALALACGAARVPSSIVGFFRGTFQPHLDQMQHAPINDPARHRLE
jgi:hypothetical protein